MNNILPFDLNLMSSLHVLIEERSVTRAANRLNISQPSMSIQLRKLRQLLDDPLFVLAGRALVPTARALEIQPLLRDLLQQLQAAVQPAPFDASTSQRVFVIAASDYSQFAVVSRLVERLRQEAPGIRVDVRTLNALTMSAQLERDEITLAITLPTSAGPQLHSRVLFRDDYVAIVRRNHPLTRGPLTMASVCKFDHLVVSPRGGAFSDELEKILAAASLQRRVAVSVQGFLLAPQLIAISDLVALVPRRLGTFGRRDVIELALPAKFQGFAVAAIWHDRVHRDPGHQWLRSSLLAVCDSAENRLAL